jgi:hypothetical protein
MIVQFDKEFAGRKVGELVNLNGHVAKQLEEKGIVSVPIEPVKKQPVKKVKK